MEKAIELNGSEINFLVQVLIEMKCPGQLTEIHALLMKKLREAQASESN